MNLNHLRFLLVLLLLLPAGCGGSEGGAPFSIAPPIQEPKEGDLSVNPNDPCVMNLGGIIENIILVYSRRRTLPASLEQLPATSVTGQKISLMCPETGKPYVYVPQGIHPPAELQPAAPSLGRRRTQRAASRRSRGGGAPGQGHAYTRPG